MWERWAAGPKLLLLLLLKVNEGDRPPLSLPSLGLLWLRNEWEGKGETGAEREVGRENDGTSSVSSMSKDLFRAAKQKKETKLTIN